MSNQTEIDRVQQLNTNNELMDAQRLTIRSLLAQRIWLINMVQQLRGVVRKDMHRLVESCGKESVRNQVEWNKEWDEVLGANYPGPEFPDLDGMATEYAVNGFISIIKWNHEPGKWVLGHDKNGALCTEGWANGAVLIFTSPELALSWVCDKHPEWLVHPEKLNSSASQVAVDNLGS